MDDPLASDLILGRRSHLSSLTPLIGIHDSVVFSANSEADEAWRAVYHAAGVKWGRFDPTGFCYVGSGCLPAATNQKISGIVFQ